jgi:hypothetical protein
MVRQLSALRKACAGCCPSKAMYPKSQRLCTLEVHRREVFRMGRVSTKKTAANAALTDYAKLVKRRALLRMQGKVPWSGDLEALRANRTDRRR